MAIAIILAYLLYIDDILSIINKKDSNIFISGALVTILSWLISTPWGIVMCIISVLLIIKPNR